MYWVHGSGSGGQSTFCVRPHQKVERHPAPRPGGNPTLLFAVESSPADHRTRIRTDPPTLPRAPRADGRVLTATVHVHPGARSSSTKNGPDRRPPQPPGDNFHQSPPAGSQRAQSFYSYLGFHNRGWYSTISKPKVSTRSASSITRFIPVFAT